MEFIAEIMGMLPIWIPALATVFLSLKSITVLTPTTVDNKIVNGALKVLNFLALNIGKDKNADAE